LILLLAGAACFGGDAPECLVQTMTVKVNGLLVGTIDSALKTYLD
jgi:hypothetical protein